MDKIASQTASKHNTKGNVVGDDILPLNFSAAFGLSLFLSGCHFKADL
jgi:hypothetical protein